MGNRSIVILVVWFAGTACAFDSLGNGDGAATLGSGEAETGDTSGSPSSASASGGSTPSTSDPGTGVMTSADPTSESNSNTTPTSESETQTESDSNADSGTESLSQGSESGTTGTASDTDTPTTTAPETTDAPEDPYPACPNGNECPETHACLQYSTYALDPAFSLCVPLGCSTSADCPETTSGNPMPICVGEPTFCTLDCEADHDGCPTGMECRYVLDIDVWRCVWPV